MLPRRCFSYNIGFILFFIVEIININIIFETTMYFILSKLIFSDKIHRVILSFSSLENFKKLTTCGKNVDGLNCMAGMKVYSMFLIILLHRNMFDFGTAVSNPKFIEQVRLF